uniref:Protein KTI12 homolog n=1 Tax=Heligmosomoides polygyrus TaxID=6339 RepID=A0A183GMJ8_HELPZ
LNYIERHRYELFLVAKQCKTTFAVLYCHAKESTCKWLNKQKEEGTRYKGATISVLISRYEKPDPRNRWDSPLYKVEVGKSEKPSSVDAPEDMNVDLEHRSPNFVDIPLTDIFSWMCERQKSIGDGQHILVTAAESGDDKVLVKRHRTLAEELKRLRRQFINISKSNPVESRAKVASLFIHYLNSSP